MQKSIIRKGLVSLVIILFIGIGINPAFAIDISKVRPSENIEDCNCQVDDNYDIVKIKSLLNRAERLVNRVEALTKLIPVLSKDNPEFMVEYKELLNDIDLFVEIHDYLENNYSVDDRPICDFLSNTLRKLFDIQVKYGDLCGKSFFDAKLILMFIYFTLIVCITLIMCPISILYFVIFMCPGIP